MSSEFAMCDGWVIALLFCQLMAIDGTLTPTQKNDIFDLIRRYGPPANEFTWDEEEHRWTLYREGTRTHRVSVLRHQATGYSCLFGDWVMVTCPGVVQKVETTAHEHSWDKKLNICGKWLVTVAFESKAPDLFKEFMESAQAHVDEAEGIAEKMGDYINRQIRRLRSAVAEDPELAIGTAKEFLETICKTILDERKIGFAKDEDLPGLVKLTIRNLKVVPDGVTPPLRISSRSTALHNSQCLHWKSRILSGPDPIKPDHRHRRREFVRRSGDLHSAGAVGV